MLEGETINLHQHYLYYQEQHSPPMFLHDQQVSYQYLSRPNNWPQLRLQPHQPAQISLHLTPDRGKFE